MRGRRGAAGAVAAVLGSTFILLSASPAAADPAGSFSSPDKDGATVTTSAVHLAGRFTPDGNGQYEGSVTLKIGDQVVGDQPFDPRPDPPFGFDVTLPANGEYVATATAMWHPWPYQLNDLRPVSTVRRFVVDAPPAAVTGVTAKANDEKRTVTVSWKPNAEPDLMGYIVSRSYNKGDYVELAPAPADAKSYVDQLTDKDAAGVYRYQVVAVRKSASGEQGLPGPPGTSKEATVKSGPASGSTTATTTAGGGNTTAGSAGPAGTNKPDASAPSLIGNSGRVDAAKFNSLLGQPQLGPDGKATRPQEPAASAIEEADPGFNDKLPYGPDGIPGTDDDAETGEMRVGVEEPAKSSKERPTTLLLLGAAALAAMCGVLMRWVLNEVKRSTDGEELERVEPAAAAELSVEELFAPPPDPVAEPVPAPVVEAPAAVRVVRPPRTRPLRSPIRAPRELDDQPRRNLVGSGVE